ncbi:MAG: Rrf2 family transcriptional regulator [Clostridiales bacterium]|nr:Rrf2 family transcriptional regulator [Clostridiales bacterium]
MEKQKDGAMLINRETDYAIRALRALADGEKKTLAVICDAEGIPQQFGYKILKKLAGANYVSIRRGKEGGYTITEAFRGKSLFDLTVIMENPTDISPCVLPDYICEKHRAEDKPCKVNKVLKVMQQELTDRLRSINLMELVSE